MSERTSKNPGIADYVVARRKHKDCFLDEIDRLIDWKLLKKLLRKKLQRVVNAVGNPAYPPLPMFKILLLQRWYNLSDVAAEESLYDRLSFVRFVGLSLDHDEVPDSSTRLLVLPAGLEATQLMGGENTKRNFTHPKAEFP